MATARPPIVWIAGALAIPVLVGIGFLAGAEPKFGIIAALALVYVLIVFTNLSAALTILVVVVFAESTPLAGPALSATKIAGLLLTLGWLARIAIHPEERRAVFFSAHPAISYLLALFVGWIALSIVWAQDIGRAWDDASGFLLVAILYVIVFSAVRTRRQAMAVIGAFVFGCAFTAAYGIVIRPDPSGAQSAVRLASTIADPNYLAMLLVAGLILGGAWIIATRGKRLLQLCAFTAVVLCGTAFLLTGSRGGIVGLGISLIAAIVFAGRWRVQVTFAAIAITGVAIGYYTALAPSLVKEKITVATAGELSQADTRSTIWTVAWRMWEDNPITGVGGGNFSLRSVDYAIEPGTTYRTDRVIDNPAVAHNTYLGPLAELGLVGLGLFLSIVGISLACLIRAIRCFERNRDGPMEVIARGLLIALAGVLAAAFFISAESNKFIWLMLAMGPALLAVAEAGFVPTPLARRRSYASVPRVAAARPLTRPS